MGVRWWGCAKDVILKGIAMIGEWQGKWRGAGGSICVRERAFLNTEFTESAEKERGEDGSDGGCRQFCERDIGYGSRAVTFCQLVSAFTECSFERAGWIRMRVADVEGSEGVGSVFRGLLRLWKCVEKSSYVITTRPF
jgi:hypothetical protein